MKCPECHIVSKLREPFTALNLPIEENSNLVDCLRAYGKKEIVQRSCSNCANIIAWKNMTVSEVPEVLVLQLKRYRNRDGRIERNSAVVSFPLELELDLLMTRPPKVR